MKEKIKNFFSKGKAWLMALWVAILTGLSQVTVSGAMVQLEQSDVSSISTSIWQGFAWMLNNTVSLIWVIALVTFWWLTIRFIGKKARGK